jgi:DNA-binding PadR family transcriptional regulator
MFMLDLAVLGLLRDGPRHGYDLKKHLASLGFLRVSFGSLYPALRRLEKRGLIEAVRASGTRKAYRVTDEGRAELDRLLKLEPETTEEDRRFSLRLAFFRYLEPALRVTSLMKRRRQLVERLRDAQQALRKAGSASADRYTLALMRRAVVNTQADIVWLDELIAAERGLAAKDKQDHANEPTGGTAWAGSK